MRASSVLQALASSTHSPLLPQGEQLEAERQAMEALNPARRAARALRDARQLGKKEARPLEAAAK